MRFIVNINNMVDLFRASGDLVLPTQDRSPTCFIQDVVGTHGVSFGTGGYVSAISNFVGGDGFFCTHPFSQVNKDPNFCKIGKCYSAREGQRPTETFSGLKYETFCAYVASTGLVFTTSLVADTYCYSQMAFRIQTTGTARFGLVTGSSSGYKNGANGTGRYFTFRVRVATASTYNASYILRGQEIQWAGDSLRQANLVLFSDGFGSVLEATKYFYACDMTLGYRTICAKMMGTNLYTYISPPNDDNVDFSTPCFSAKIANSNSGELLYWGKLGGSNTNTDIYWDYIGWFNHTSGLTAGTALGAYTSTTSFKNNTDTDTILGEIPTQEETNNYLHIQTPIVGTALQYFKQDTAGQYWVDTVTSDRGYVISATILGSLYTVGSAGGQQIWWADGLFEQLLVFENEALRVDDGSTVSTYPLDMTTYVNKSFKIAVYGTGFAIYTNCKAGMVGTNALLMRGNRTNPSADKFIKFGACTNTVNCGGSMRWVDFRFLTEHEPEFGIVPVANASCPTGYALQMVAGSSLPAKDGIFLQYAPTASDPFYKLSAYTGYTIEFKAKVVTTSERHGFGQALGLNDNYSTPRLELHGTGVRLTTSDYYLMDTTNDFHKYRLCVINNPNSVYTYKLYVDDMLRLEDNFPPLSSGLNLRFGCLSNSFGGTTQWEYIRYSAEGAFEPNNGEKIGWVYAKLGIADKKRTEVNQRLRNDASTVLQGKASPAKIALEGSIFGTCWESLLSAVRRCKKFLSSPDTKICIDDQISMDATLADFTYKQENSKFVKYTANMQGKTPYWFKVSPSYISTDVSGSIYLNNQGDVPVPLRIIMTGAVTGGGSIDDNIELTNATTNQNMKYRGVLQETQELLIDGGYGTYGEYQCVIGTGNVFGSYEGDFIILNTGINTLAFSGGAISTIEFYWREGYQI